MKVPRTPPTAATWAVTVSPGRTRGRQSERDGDDVRPPRGPSTSGRGLLLGTRITLAVLIGVPLLLMARIAVDEWRHVGTGSITGTAVTQRCVTKMIETTEYITCYGSFAATSSDPSASATDSTASPHEVRIAGVETVDTTVTATTAAGSDWVVEGTSPWRVIPRTFGRCLPVGMAGVGIIVVGIFVLITVVVAWVGIKVSRALASSQQLPRINS